MTTGEGSTQDAYETTLPALPESGRQARAAVEAQCRAWGLGQLCEDAALIVAELVSNAVRHSRPPILLRFRRRERGVRMEVSDGSMRRPQAARGPLMAESGRGLLLVKALASRYGVDARPDGKTVWAELDAPA